MNYNPSIHNDARPNVGVTVVPLAFNSKDGTIETLTYVRSKDAEVFAEKISLPNGVYDRRTVSNSDDAAKNALKEKVRVDLPYIEQLYTFSGDYIDPERINTVNIAYMSVLSKENVVNTPQDNGLVAKWVSVDFLLGLGEEKFAFNHKEVLRMAYDRLKSKAEYTPIALNLLSKEFTIGEFQSVTELLLGCPVSKPRFRDRIKKCNLLKESGSKKIIPGGISGGKPAQLYVYNDEFEGGFFPMSLAHKK